MTDEYRQALREVANGLLREGVLATQDYLERLIENEREKVDRLIELRAVFPSSDTRERLKGMLDLSLFQAYDEHSRQLCFVIDKELSDLVDFLRLEKRCGPYRTQQELFLKCPSLMPFIEEEHLIDLQHLRQVGSSQFVLVKGGYAKLDEFLDAALIKYFERKYGRKKIFVRLDAAYFSTNPERSVNDPGTQMISPKLVKKIRLNKLNPQCGPYLLEEGDSESPSPTFWEYHVKNVRRLEVKVKHSGNGKLSMVLEELSQKNDTLVVGRYLRADTYPKAGMSLSDAVLDSLELSLNVYHDGLSKTRLDRSLSLEQRATTSARMALLQIKGIPFRETLNACRHFFDGKSLVAQWIRDQFEGLE